MSRTEPILFTAEQSAEAELTELPKVEVPVPKNSWFDSHKFRESIQANGDLYHYEYFLEGKAFDGQQLVNWLGLLSGLPDFWSQLEARHPGKVTPVPRLSALCSDGPIGQEVEIKTVIYSTVRPPALISDLWTRVCNKLGWQRPFGDVVALRFSEPAHSVGYHNWEPEDPSSDLPAVVYLWLGRSRPVLWRNADKKVTKKLTMDDGHLFVAPRDTWVDWKFQVPKNKSFQGQSILLIFR